MRYVGLKILAPRPLHWWELLVLVRARSVSDGQINPSLTLQALSTREATNHVDAFDSTRYSQPMLDTLKDVIARTWGFRELRPLQEPAMRAVLDGRDSLVVLPTGGGKSLCYQAPAVLRGDTTVVVSPLISLMKDQVDSLQSCGVPAIQINSSQSETERSAYQ